MKCLKPFLPLCLVPCAGLLIVSGCGSGGGTSSIAPIAAAPATPTPASSPCSSEVTTSPTYAQTGINAGATVPAIEISWTPPCDVDETRVVEYHVFRDNVLIGVGRRDRRGFTDSTLIGNPFPFQAPTVQTPPAFTAGNLNPSLVLYNYSASSIVGPRLAAAMAGVSGSTTAPRQYQITVVYSRQVNGATEYVEAPLGTSATVTPPQQ